MGLKHFLCPELKRSLVLRILFIAVISVVFFGIFRPCLIVGSSMEPSYHDRSVMLNFTLRYMCSPVKRGDVVIVSYFGKEYLLKRVVALAGDTVEFRSGKLLVNGETIEEKYVKHPGDWTIPEVTVGEGCCYVLGDNRGQSHLEHKHGQISMDRISGGPLW
ncbi:MAG: signal peptidase I [Lentisphaerae bacterium]|nr:signal peptidase I [Lentisphaerota bacterium]